MKSVSLTINGIDWDNVIPGNLVAFITSLIRHIRGRKQLWLRMGSMNEYSWWIIAHHTLFGHWVYKTCLFDLNINLPSGFFVPNPSMCYLTNTNILANFARASYVNIMISLVYSATLHSSSVMKKCLYMYPQIYQVFAKNGCTGIMTVIYIS